MVTDPTERECCARGDFGPRKPSFGKPMGVKPGNGGKVFLPRDAKKRNAHNA